MNIQSIAATQTATERRVRVEFADGTTRSYTFGMVQDKDGAWVLPDPAVVAREVNALLEAEITPGETKDTAFADALASISPAMAAITNQPASETAIKEVL